MNKKMKRNIIIAGAALLLVVALILVLIFVPFGGGDDSPSEIDYGIDIELGVNADGLHTAQVQTNSKGEIENNSYGTLIDYVPAQIDKISMSTPEGNYTFLLSTPVDSEGETDATVYTLEGFEDFDLAATNPSLLASAVSSIGFTKVADLSGENAAEYGFDAPRAEATVYFNDDTHSVVRLGDDAPGGTYCYIQFGDNKTVYVAAIADMEPMLLKITDLFSTSINGDATSIADDSFDKITLGGTHLAEEIVIEANSDKALSCYYVMSSHGNAPVNTVEGSEIVGSIKSLTADSVVCVNPDGAQLKEYGLDNPFATVKTSYTYTDTQYDSEGNEVGSEEKILKVSLMASEADSDGFVYMMQEDGKLIYKISADSVAWATTDATQLKGEYVLNPSYSALETVTVKAGDKTYVFELSSKEVTETDEQGNETTTTQITVTYGGKAVDEDQFYVLYQDMALAELGGEDDGKNAGGELLSITYEYNTGRAKDTVIYRSTGTQKAVAELNGKAVGYVYKSYVTALSDNIKKLSEGKEIASVL